MLWIELVPHSQRITKNTRPNIFFFGGGGVGTHSTARFVELIYQHSTNKWVFKVIIRLQSSLMFLLRCCGAMVRIMPCRIVNFYIYTVDIYGMLSLCGPVSKKIFFSFHPTHTIPSPTHSIHPSWHIWDIVKHAPPHPPLYLTRLKL